MNAPISAYGLSRPVRIALFSGNYNYTVDGANKSLNRLVAHLLGKTGAKVRIYSPTGPEPAFPPVGDLVSVPSVALPLRTDYRMALGMPRPIRKDLEQFRPDIIHLSAPDLLGMAAKRFARRHGVPVVTSVHTHFDSYLAYYKLDWLADLARRKLQAFYDDSDFILAPTPAMAEELAARARTACVRVWARGVDFDLFNPGRRSGAWRQEKGFDEARPVIVFMGRIVMEKGLAVFADAIDRLKATGEAPQVLVIGEGPARRWFEERLPGAVFTGFLSGAALATAVASGDIFLNPSVTETFGNVNLEAMASGLAMVCADAPNTRSLLQDVGGLLCRPADPESYAAALRSLISDQAFRARMGAEAQTLSARYRWSDVLDAVVEAYGEALGAHHPARLGLHPDLGRLPDLVANSEAELAGSSRRM